MKEQKSLNWRTELRIVWAILSKDLVEALKNKNAISVIITALFLSVAYSFMPALTSLDNATNLLVYDAASSSLSAQLKASQALEVYLYPSEEVMLEKLARGEVPELGLVIPADFSASLAADQDQQALPTLTGYVLYWASREKIDRLTQEVEAEITRL